MADNDNLGSSGSSDEIVEKDSGSSEKSSTDESTGSEGGMSGSSSSKDDSGGLSGSQSDGQSGGIREPGSSSSGESDISESNR
jgi:hypothetical protein